MSPQYHVITLFPEMFAALTDFGVSGRAVKQQLCGVRFWNPRDFTQDNYHTVDDRPFGGGPGMVMLVEPLDLALSAARTVLRRQGIPARWDMPIRRARIPSPMACWIVRTTRGRRSISG